MVKSSQSSKLSCREERKSCSNLNFSVVLSVFVAETFHYARQIMLSEKNIRVEQGSGGDYTTIGAALEAVKGRSDGPFSITVGGGTFEEQLEFSNSLVSIIAGPDCTPILIGKEYGVIVSESVRFAGVRFASPKEHVPAVTVLSKSPQFDKCTIEHLRVDLKGSPVVTSSTFSGSVSTGISFAGVSSGLVDSCTFLSNRLYGVLVEGSATPTIRNCSVTMSGKGAVVLCGQSRAILVDSNVQDSTGLGDPRAIPGSRLNGSVCERAGIVIGNGATPTVRGNTIFSCSGHGIAVFGGTFAPTKIAANGTVTSSKLNPARNAFEGSTLIEGNTIRSNNGLGIFVAASVPPLVLKHNMVTENSRGGALFASSDTFAIADAGTSNARSRCELVSNTFLENGMFGIRGIGCNTSLDISDSKIENQPQGIASVDGCAMTVQNCRLQRCEIAVLSSTNARMVVSSTTVFDNQVGVCCDSYGSLSAVDVVFEANTTGALLRLASQSRIVNCIFRRNKVGIAAESKASGLVEDCSLTNSEDVCVASGTGARIHFARCTLNGSLLLRSDRGCQCLFKENTFLVNGSQGKGIVVSEGADPTLIRNTVRIGDGAVGFELMTASCGIFLANTLTGGQTGFRAHASSLSTVRGNVLSELDIAFDISQGACCVIEKNDVRGSRVGFAVSGGSSGLPVVASNTVSDCAVGIAVSGGESEGGWPKIDGNCITGCKVGLECINSHARLTRNVLYHCTLGGRIQGIGPPVLIGCVFAECVEGGLFILSGADCTLSNSRFEGNVGAAKRGARGRFGLCLDGECSVQARDCVFAFNDVGLLQMQATQDVKSHFFGCVFRRNYRGAVAEGVGGLDATKCGGGLLLDACSFLKDTRGALAGEGAALSLQSCLFHGCGTAVSAPVYSVAVALKAAQCIFYRNQLHLSGMCTSSLKAHSPKYVIEQVAADNVSGLGGIVAVECIFYATASGAPMPVDLPVLLFKCLFACLGVSVNGGAPSFVCCSFVGASAPLTASFQCIGTQIPQFSLPTREGASVYRQQLLGNDRRRALSVTAEFYGECAGIECGGSSSPWIVACTFSFYPRGVVLRRTNACVLGASLAYMRDSAISIEDGFDGRVLHCRCSVNFGPGLIVRGRLSMTNRHFPRYTWDASNSPGFAVGEIRKLLVLCGGETHRAPVAHIIITKCMITPFVASAHTQTFEREIAFSGVEEHASDGSNVHHKGSMNVCQPHTCGGVGILVIDSGSLQCEGVVVSQCNVAAIVCDGSRGQLAKRHSLISPTISHSPYGLVLRPGVEGVDVENGVVHSCHYAGLSGEQGSKLVMKGSVVSGCGVGYVGVGDRGEFSRTLFHNNTLAGVRMGSGCRSLITDCDITENANGVEVYSPLATCPHVLKTRVFANRHMGFLVSGDCSPIIEECHIYRHVTQCAVMIRCGASPIVRNNAIVQNATGVVCRLQSTPSISRNSILHNRIGALVEWQGEGIWDLNSFSCNTTSSILTRTKGHPVVKRCVFIRDCPIHVTMEGRGVYALNTFRDASSQCIVVTRGGCPLILRTSFIGSRACDLLPWGLLREEVGDGEEILAKDGKMPYNLSDFAEGALAASSYDGSIQYAPLQPLIEVADGGVGLVADCVFAAADSGILVHGPASCPSIEGCAFFHCEVGVQCLAGSHPTINRCGTAHGKVGIYSRGASPHIDDCVMDVCESGIAVLEGGNPVVRGTSVRRSGVGIFVGPSSTATILSSRVVRCSIGVVSKMCSNPRVEGTSILQCTLVGIQLSTLGAASVSECFVAGSPIGLQIRGSRLSEATARGITIVGCDLGIDVSSTREMEEAELELSWSMVKEGLKDELQGAVRKKVGRRSVVQAAQRAALTGCTILRCSVGVHYHGNSCCAVSEGIHVALGSTGIAVDGEGTSPLIRDSSVVGCERGVTVSDNADLSLEVSVIAECTNGLAVDGATSSILACKVVNSTQTGVGLGKGAKGRIDKCEIINSGAADLVCASGSSMGIGDNLIRCTARPEERVLGLDEANVLVTGELRIEHTSPDLLRNESFEKSISTSKSEAAQHLEEMSSADGRVALALREHFQGLGIGTSESPAVRSFYEVLEAVLDRVKEGTEQGYTFHMLTPRSRGALNHLTSSVRGQSERLHTLPEFVKGTATSSRLTAGLLAPLCSDEEEFDSSCGKLIAGANLPTSLVEGVEWGRYPPKERWELQGPEGPQTVIDRLRMRANGGNPRARLYSMQMGNAAEEDVIPFCPSPPRPAHRTPYPRATLQGLSSRHSEVAQVGSTCLPTFTPSSLATQALEMQTIPQGYSHLMQQQLSATREQFGVFAAAQLLQEFIAVDVRMRQSITYSDTCRFIQRVVARHGSSLDLTASDSATIPLWAAAVGADAFKMSGKDPFKDELTLQEFGTFAAAPSRWRALLDEHFPWLRVANQGTKRLV